MKRNPCNDCKHLVFTDTRIISLPFCKERENPNPETLHLNDKFCNALNRKLYNLKPIYCSSFSVLTKIKQENDN